MEPSVVAILIHLLVLPGIFIPDNHRDDVVSANKTLRSSTALRLPARSIDLSLRHNVSGDAQLILRLELARQAPVVLIDSHRIVGELSGRRAIKLIFESAAAQFVKWIHAKLQLVVNQTRIGQAWKLGRAIFRIADLLEQDNRVQLRCQRRETELDLVPHGRIAQSLRHLEHVELDLFLDCPVGELLGNGPEVEPGVRQLVSKVLVVSEEVDGALLLQRQLDDRVSVGA